MLGVSAAALAPLGSAPETEVISNAISSPAAPTGPWKRQTFVAANCTTPPKIDGILDDPCWKNATHIVGFYRFAGDSPVVEQTEAWLCADRTHLYIAFHCLDSKPQLIKARETQRNGNVTADDCVQIVIDSQGSRRNNSQFNVNARGTQSSQIDGGTADNITWAGDWKAATGKTSDGWTVEIAIPFALLRHPKKAHTFPIVLARQLSRETYPEVWPYIPKEGQNDVLKFLPDVKGFDPIDYAPRPVFLPYNLATAGQGSSARSGMDIKYPISTTLTGVATLYPDFATVEQSIQNVNFSYTQKFIQERRPFFAEGSGFMPDSSLFYSPQIQQIDEGFKVVGRQGQTNIGTLGTIRGGAGGQSDVVLSGSQDLGVYSKVGGALVANNQAGDPANRIGNVFGAYGWKTGQKTFMLTGSTSRSWLQGSSSDTSNYYDFNANLGPSRIDYDLNYLEIGPSFTNQIGYLPEVDLRGWGGGIGTGKSYEKGAVENIGGGIGFSAFRHVSGGFYKDAISPGGSVFLRNGWGLSLNDTISKREDFHDHVADTTLFWGQKTLFQTGSFDFAFGRQAGQSYTFWNFNQGILVRRPFSLQFNADRLRLGDTVANQMILTGTYRLSGYRAIGARLLNQAGQTNLFLSFSQQVSSGLDVFVLLGDPNSAKTRGIVTVKLVRPF